MSNWRECEILERDIILSIKRKSLTITGISNKIKRAKPTVSEAITRLVQQEIVSKKRNYGKDARNVRIILHQERVKIEKTHTFYTIYFILASLPFAISLIISLILEQYFLLIGAAAELLPPLLFIIYNVYIKEDKIVVYKSPKILKKEKKSEGKEVSEIS